MWTERITILCFGASYAAALLLELLQLRWPRPAQRVIGYAFGAAGLLAHTIFLTVQRPPLAAPSGSMLWLAWILAVFYFYGSIHHRKRAWAIFVLPLVLGLILLAWSFRIGADSPGPNTPDKYNWTEFWGLLHGTLLLLAAVGVCVGCVASVMYLIQARRLKTKAPPGQGLRLLSLERLEAMNRRALNVAFPLLTAGVLVGVILMFQPGTGAPAFFEQGAAKIIASGVLWLVFALLLILRYGIRLRGRSLALLTILAFALLLFTLASAHPVMGQGGGP